LTNSKQYDIFSVVKNIKECVMKYSILSLAIKGDTAWEGEVEKGIFCNKNVRIGSINNTIDGITIVVFGDVEVIKGEFGFDYQIVLKER